MPTSPSPRASFWTTESTAWPPEAQAFSTASIGLASSPGTEATSPARRPWRLRVKPQAAPIEATSISAAATPSSSQAPVTAAAIISGTVMAPSLPKGD